MDEGFGNTCHTAVRGLSDRRAPGLEQERFKRQDDWNCIYRADGCRRRLGRADTCGRWSLGACVLAGAALRGLASLAKIKQQRKSA